MNMDDQAQPGDIVRLKSGGRHMTAGKESHNNADVLTCYWFEDGELRKSEVPKAALEKARLQSPI
jgi:uncharacterized protein YodC (DUF2158 family)